MAEYAPVMLKIIDYEGQQLFSQSVPFEPELDVRGIMERAFVLSQTIAQPDPFVFELQYYGYSEVLEFPGYLGYEVESICGKPNTPQFFWQLSVNDVISTEGADSLQPGPRSTVLWAYTSIENLRRLSGHAQVLHERRSGRQAKST